MDTNRFTRIDSATWRIELYGAMRVPAIIYADESLIREMDDKVYEQAANVATLPAIVQASYAMPDAHWGYGFPIGGVAAFDPEEGGVVSAGGVGFDISCGTAPAEHSRAMRLSGSGVAARSSMTSLSEASSSRARLCAVSPRRRRADSSESFAKGALL